MEREGLDFKSTITTLAERNNIQLKLSPEEELKQKSVAEIQFLENAHPNGYSLTKVLEKHESFMRRLVGLTKTLKLPAKKKN